MRGPLDHAGTLLARAMLLLLDMTHPAEPERRDPRVGISNPHQSLWVIDHPYLGPPEEGQPRVDRPVEPLVEEEATQPHKAA